jgi:cation transport ATPase
VVATPCPLILAAPAAIIAGVSRAAKHGIIVKGGGPLETLARVRVVLLDKTGTVTSARPQVIAVEAFGSMTADELVRLAGSLEQVSLHPYAPPVVAEASHRGLSLSFPTEVVEQMGAGIAGCVDGRRVSVGHLGFVSPTARATAAMRSVQVRTAVEGSASVYVAIDGELAGALLLQDPIRPEAPRALRSLRKLGVQRIDMVTGDHPDVADLVGDALGVDRVFAERTPEEKVEIVRMVRRDGVTAMVGDGINDAPALALADVGIAMGARGTTAASEAADVVLTSDRLETLVLAIRIAKRTRSIAVQSVAVGMGLSIVAMVAAAAGYISPVVGAVLQEGIDVLVIFGALRALGDGGLAPRTSATSRELALELSSAHATLRPRVAELAALAAGLDALSPADARARLVATHVMLVDELLPHEEAEQQTAYPMLSDLLKDEDPTGALVQTHHEIRRLTRLYARLVAQLPDAGPGPDDIRDLRRLLFGLHAILTLHFAQEEELYSLLG